MWFNVCIRAKEEDREGYRERVREKVRKKDRERFTLFGWEALTDNPVGAGLGCI